MSDLATYRQAAPYPEESGADTYLVQAQNLLAQAVSQTLMAQAAVQHRLDSVEHNVAALSKQIRELASNSDLITVVQLQVMLQIDWDETEKQAVGTQLGRFTRKMGVPPRKVPHPTLAGGVNGYEPGIIKAWLEEETEFKVPDVLRYVP